NTGTQFDPLQTFNRALELVNNSTRDSDTEFRIFLQTDVADGAMLVLNGGKKLTVASVGADGTARTITSLGRTFTVSSESELTVQSVAFEKLRFDVSGTFAMDGGEISGNTADNGGAICINASGKATISNTKIFENTADTNGGGVYVTGGSFEMKDSEISKNEALDTSLGSGGGVCVYNGTFIMDGGKISENKAKGNSDIFSGGGIWVGGSIAFTMKGGTVSGNKAEYGGGILVNGSGTFKMDNDTFSGNTATTAGGAIYVKNGTLIMNSSIISDNIASNSGGGVYINDKVSFTMESGEISGNETNSNGGGVYVTGNASTFTITGGTLNGNEAGASGGAVYVYSGKFIMSDTATISGNKAIGSHGGGICCVTNNATFEMNNGTISGNTANKNGGSVYVTSGARFTMSGGTVSGNNASGDGGGVYVTGNASTFTMTGGTIGNDNAAQNGGGVYVANSGMFTMSGTAAISGNKATNGNGDYPGQGGGVYVYSATLEMSGTAKITGNNAYTSGGGIYIYKNADATATLTMRGGEISKNTANGDGRGVYNQNGVFTMSGTAKIADDNDVYLNNGATITVADTLTAESPVATITPSAYELDRPVLSAGGVSIDNAVCAKFALTPESDDAETEWNIMPDSTGANGVLKTKMDIYVRGNNATWYESNEPTASEGSDTTGNGSKTKPFATIQKAVDTVIANNDGADEYTIYVDGKFTATSTTKLANFDGVSQALSVKIVGLDASNKPVLDGNDMANCVTVGSKGQRNLNLTLENLVITNGKALGNSNGGGIFFNGKSLEMTGCEVIKCEAKGGGGVCVNNGTFTMNGGTIENNKAEKGGGVYVTNGAKFTMSGTAKITGNNASGDGGGVALNGGTFTINDGTISNNTAVYGAGIHVNGGSKVTMTGGEISGNTATGENDSGGGGIHLYDGTFEMSGGTVTGNEAKGTAERAGGGGMYIYQRNTNKFTMTGGSFRGNRANLGKGAFICKDVINGSGTPQCGLLEMSDGAIFGSDNDVYLYDNAPGTGTAPTITVAGSLTAASPVATITPSAYTVGRQVLSAGGSIPAITQDICGKFAVTYQYGTNWIIMPNDTRANGVLMTTNTVYLNASSGSDTNSGLTASKAVKTLSKAIELYDTYPSGEIMLCAEYTLANGENTLLNRAGKRTLTLRRYDGSSDVSGSFTGNLLMISQGDVTITKVTLDGNKDNVTATGPLLYISGGKVTLGDGATICNNETNGNGGGVYVDDGTFEMSGTISGCTANSGGGIYNSADGTLIMKGGKISNNNAESFGGGIYNTGVATISGGTIASCKVTGHVSNNGGGGIYSTRRLTVISGIIKNCNARYTRGGGVQVSSGTFEMSGGEISDNVAYYGGGVCVAYEDTSIFTMTGGKIIDNEAWSQGGGVYVGGKFTMSDGEISGNTAQDGGDGVYKSPVGTFTHTGGTVQAD
ncbi:MAG: hypothetical protein K2J81_01480, partial [Treponemataceae bacterium]|nr:hypothetical protein [Treponemataceae bacterium]